MFHKRQSPRPIETVSCAQCGKEFLIRPSRREKSVSGNVFCSPQCAGQHYATTLPHNATCAFCGKSFHRSPSGLKRRVTEYTYSECYTQAKRAGMSIRKPVEWQDSDKVACDNCGNLFHLSPSRLQKGERHFCSNKCQGEYFTKTGFSKVQEHREQIIAEAGSRCEICGVDDYRVLVIHHKDRDRANNRRENLMVVCANCHTRIHKGLLPKWSALFKRK